MSENDNFVLNEDVEPIMPDGWTEGDDIFSDDESDLNAALAAVGTQESVEQPEEGGETRTTESEQSETGDSEAQLEAELQAAKSASKLRFKAQYNHEDMDVELDEADLPSVYQKSLFYDGAKEKLSKQSLTIDKAEKLARSMGYENVDVMLDSAAKNYRQGEIDRLVADGVHRAVAEDIVDRKLSKAEAAQPPETEPRGKQPETKSAQEVSKPTQAAAKEQKPSKGGRSWSTEVAELMKARPQLAGKQFPKEVQTEAIKTGKSLLLAYLEYETKQNSAEINRLKKANSTHEQNAASAAKAPVRGVTGGGSTDTSPSDPFMDGFNSVF